MPLVRSAKPARARLLRIEHTSLLWKLGPGTRERNLGARVFCQRRGRIGAPRALLRIVRLALNAWWSASTMGASSTRAGAAPPAVRAELAQASRLPAARLISSKP